MNTEFLDELVLLLLMFEKLRQTFAARVIIVDNYRSREFGQEIKQFGKTIEAASPTINGGTMTYGIIERLI